MREPRLLRAHSWRERLRDPRSIAAIAAAALVVVLAAVLSGRGPDAVGVMDASPTPTATHAVGESTGAAPTPQARTPGPTPAIVGEPRTAATSAPVASTVPPQTPTPSPDPKVWRFEGVVVDEEGQPLEGVCVVIGPQGCRPFSPHTDDRGVYYFDVPQVPNVAYELTFVMEGYEPVFHLANPDGHTVFNVVMGKTS